MWRASFFFFFPDVTCFQEMQVDTFVWSQMPMGLVDFALSRSCNQALCAREPELSAMTLTGQESGLV